MTDTENSAERGGKLLLSMTPRMKESLDKSENRHHWWANFIGTAYGCLAADIGIDDAKELFEHISDDRCNDGLRKLED